MGPNRISHWYESCGLRVSTNAFLLFTIPMFCFEFCTVCLSIERGHQTHLFMGFFLVLWSDFDFVFFSGDGTMMVDTQERAHCCQIHRSFSRRSMGCFRGWNNGWWSRYSGRGRIAVRYTRSFHFHNSVGCVQRAKICSSPNTFLLEW